MAESFDPYHIWLGIPPAEQPADHYRLLGISRFESNLDVISNAADQRVRHIRSMQTGKRQAESQRLLNEIAAAAGVLLDPDRRRAYDSGLVASSTKNPATAPAASRQRVEADGVNPPPVRAVEADLPVARPIPAPQPQRPPTAMAPVQAASTIHSPPAPLSESTGRVQSRKWFAIAGLASLGGLVFLAGLSYFVRSMLMSSTQPLATNLPTALPSGTVVPILGPNSTDAPANPLPAWLAEYERQTDFKFSPLAAAHSYVYKAKVDKLQGRIELQDFQDGSCGINAAHPAWFVLDAKVTRLEGDGSLAFNFAFGGTGQSMVLDGYRERGYLSGISTVRGVPIEFRRDATVHTGQLFPVNAATMISLYVGNGSVCCVLKRDQKIESIFNWHEPGLVAQAGESPGTSVSPTLQVSSKSSRWVVDDLQITPLCLKGNVGLAQNSFGSPGPPPWVNEWAMKGRSLKLVALYGVTPLAGERMVVESIGRTKTSSTGVQSAEFETLPPADYFFQVELGRVGQGPMAVDFPVGGKQCRIVIDRLIDKTYWSGIEVLGGLPLQSRQDPSVVRGQQILEHQSTFLEIFVYKSRVSAKIVSGPQTNYITWIGNPGILGRSSEFPLASAGKIGLSSKDASYTFLPRLSPLGNEPLATSNISNRNSATSSSKMPAAVSVPPPASAVKGTETAHAKSPESPSAAVETSKLPIPAAAELAKAHEELREAFGDFEDMPEKKGYWAREFIAVANSEKSVAVSYVMLDTARRLAIDAQDLKMAVEAIQKMRHKFQIDDTRLYLDTLKLTSGKTMPYDKWEAFAIAAIMFSQTAVNNRRGDMAIEGSQLAVELAAKGRSQDLRNQAGKSLELALEYKKSEGLLAEAMQKLANDPNDPEANLFTGKWYSLILGDFGKGLPYLSKGADPLLATAAQTEQQPGVKEIAVADAWFEAGSKLSGREKIAALKHSRELYGRARANSSGLEQLRAEKRGSEVQKAIDDADKEKTGRPNRP